MDAESRCLGGRSTGEGTVRLGTSLVLVLLLAIIVVATAVQLTRASNL